MTNAYDIDTAVQVSSAFADLSGAAIDPNTVTLYILAPDGTKTTVTMGSLTHGGTGVFSYAIDANQSGLWTYKFQGQGNVEVTSTDAGFFVKSSKLIAG